MITKLLNFCAGGLLLQPELTAIFCIAYERVGFKNCLPTELKAFSQYQYYATHTPLDKNCQEEISKTI